MLLSCFSHYFFASKTYLCSENPTLHISVVVFLLGQPDFIQSYLSGSLSLKGLFGIILSLSRKENIVISQTHGKPCHCGFTCDEAHNRHPSSPQTVDLDSLLSCCSEGTSRQIEQRPWLEIYVSTCLAGQWAPLVCLPRNHIQRFADIFVDFHFMNKAILVNQCMFVCICVCAGEWISAVWKVLRLGEKNSWTHPPLQKVTSLSWCPIELQL